MMRPMTAEIERALLTALRKGEGAEPYDLPETSIPGLERTLTRVLASEKKLDEVKRALALAAGLRTLGAIAASDRIEAMLRANPQAIALIAEHLTPAKEHRKPEQLRAPMIDAPKHAGPRVADFLNPGRTDRIRR